MVFFPLLSTISAVFCIISFYRKLDEELEYTARKYLGAETVAALPRPIHINIMLGTQHDPREFVNVSMRSQGKSLRITLENKFITHYFVH